MNVGTSAVLVLPQDDGSLLEVDALVLDLIEDQAGTVARRAANLAYCSPVETDATPFGRALKTLKSVPHEICREVGALKGGEYWHERGGAA